MSILDNFSKEAESLQFHLKSTNELNQKRRVSLENDALFHLPFIAMSILAIAKDRKFKLKTGQVGQIIGLVFEKSFPAFKGSNQHLEWSANLRSRTARSLVFLEDIKFVNVEDEKIIPTVLGKSFINKVLREASQLGLKTRLVSVKYRELQIDGILELY